jgi:hypothetical protein
MIRKQDMTRVHPRSPRSLVAGGRRVATVFVAAVAAVVFGLGLGGCSFKVMRPPPARGDWPDPVTPSSSQAKCTRSPAPPVLDTSVALILGTLSYVERDSGSRRWFTPATGAAALPFLASAIYGYWNMGRCRQYQSLFTDQWQGLQN